MLDVASQLWIAAFGLPAIWLVNCKGAKARRAGAWIGLFAGVGWYTQVCIHDQYWTLPVHFCYTAAWVKGIWSNRT